MTFLDSKLKTAANWEKLAKCFFGHWEEVGFGNLNQSKLEALFAYCLYVEGIIPANGKRISLTEAQALNKDPAELDRLITKGFTLFNKEPVDSDRLLDTLLRCLVSSQDRLIQGSLEFHCASQLDRRYIIEFFERCGINPEQGRNSKILLVELSSIDSDRINANAVFNGLCAQLGVQAIQQSNNIAAKNGTWLVRCFKQIGPELFKSGVAVFCRELFTQLIHYSC